MLPEVEAESSPLNWQKSPVYFFFNWSFADFPTACKFQVYKTITGFKDHAPFIVITNIGSIPCAGQFIAYFIHSSLHLSIPYPIQVLSPFLFPLPTGNRVCSLYLRVHSLLLYSLLYVILQILHMTTQSTHLPLTHFTTHTPFKSIHAVNGKFPSFYGRVVFVCNTCVHIHDYIYIHHIFFTHPTPNSFPLR